MKCSRVKPFCGPHVRASLVEKCRDGGTVGDAVRCELLCQHLAQQSCSLWPLPTEPTRCNCSTEADLIWIQFCLGHRAQKSQSAFPLFSLFACTDCGGKAKLARKHLHLRHLAQQF
ncbi:unnamed protein product [Polarella glacialis]|uniref:Uncharacterized protein n=1 Tax=Polarella glacialis TaxID=89957 RepID=A0A813GF53_POLGL|nr:unnamed protein product [Polarella glacialis]